MENDKVLHVEQFEIICEEIAVVSAVDLDNDVSTVEVDKAASHVNQEFCATFREQLHVGSRANGR